MSNFHKFYIGPAQVSAGGILQIPGGDGVRRVPIRKGVDIERLKELAAQNMLVLIYTLLLYKRKDQPPLQVWTKHDNRFNEHLYLTGFVRESNGDIRLTFAHEKGSQPDLRTTLSNICLIEFSNPGRVTPPYVLERLTNPPEVNAPAEAEAALTKDEKRTGSCREPGMYLRWPDTGERVLLRDYKYFFNYARGESLPEPYTVEGGGQVILKAPPPKQTQRPPRRKRARTRPEQQA